MTATSNNRSATSCKKSKRWDSQVFKTSKIIEIGLEFIEIQQNEDHKMIHENHHIFEIFFDKNFKKVEHEIWWFHWFSSDENNSAVSWSCKRQKHIPVLGIRKIEQAREKGLAGCAIRETWSIVIELACRLHSCRCCLVSFCVSFDSS